MSAVDKSVLIYNLMHKDKEVAVFSFMESKLSQIQITNKRYVPLGCYKEEHLKMWWEQRSVPKTRKGINKILAAFNIPDTESLVLNNLGLSLSDCYWVKPLGSILTWESVNYFNNNFSDIMTDISLQNINFTQFKAQTPFLPSITTNGDLQKKWIILPNGTRALVKGNHGNHYQQSYNETFATLVNSRQNVVYYTIYELFDLKCMSGKGMGCICANLCNENYEIFSAWSVLRNYRYLKNMGYYMALKHIAIQNLGLSEQDVQRFLDYEIMLDFVLTNLDRHMNNISFMRDCNTLEVVGFAPIYDNGNSMFWDFKEVPQGTDILRLKTSTFNSTEVHNLRYVQDRGLLQIDKLPTADEVRLHYQQDSTMSEEFLEDIIRGYMLKVAYLQEFQNGVAIWDIPCKKGYFNM